MMMIHNAATQFQSRSYTITMLMMRHYAKAANQLETIKEITCIKLWTNKVD